jgi:ferric-dicitrate binding protein FerR (iron transport regulator)
MRSTKTDESPSTTRAGVTPLSSIEEAADWFLRARDRRFTLDEQQALLHWLKQSPQHIAEFIHMYQLHGLLRAAKLEPFEPDQRSLSPDDVRDPGPFEEHRVSIGSVLGHVALVVAGLLVGLCVVLLIGR